ncbi:MAG TPA: universal stress protein [Solirubrobacteraceae bacterium]|nr:universal stress protein [Solirubrobacteraceae bacterium]
MSAGVVVGYDGSAGAKEAVRVALEVGKAYAERVVIAFAYELSPVGGELHDYHAALKELATQRLVEATALAAGAEVDVEAVIVEQAPAPALVALAAERGARVIVVGTRGESPIRGALLGSTPHKLLHLSDRPVLIVPVPN